MSDEGPTDVIHDIGFRHYDGVRLGRGWIVRSLFVETLRGVFGLGRSAKGKTMPWVLIGILLVPALVMVIIMMAIPGTGLPMQYNEYLYGFQFILALFVASRAPYCVSRDLRDGVMPLYLSRPLTNRDYVVAKFGGLSIGLFTVMVAPLTLLFAGTLLAQMPPGEQFTAWLKGIVVAGLLAVLLSAIGLAIASATPRRGIGVAGIITALLLTNGLSGILVPLLREKGADALAKYFVAFNPFGLVDGLGTSLLGLDTGNDLPPPTTFTGGVILLAIFALLVLACIALILRRYRRLGRV